MFSEKLGVEDWWDKSTSAGPASRARTEYPEPHPTMQILSIDGDDLKFLGPLKCTSIRVGLPTHSLHNVAIDLECLEIYQLTVYMMSQ